jgi:hypothetical protein
MNSVNRGHIYMLIIMLYMLAAQILMGIIINATGIELSFTANALISQYVLILLPAIIYFIITKSSIKNTLKFKKRYDVYACSSTAFLTGSYTGISRGDYF